MFHHWLLYDRYSSNNHNNNNNVSVIQVCVSKLTAHRALILYDAYVAALILVTVDVDSVLFVDQQQLVQYTHFSQTRAIFTLLSVNVLFIQLCITSKQIKTHQLLYINAILIQSQDVLISDSCTDCQKHSMTLFLKCCCMSEHFSECYSNCKWHDHAAYYFVHNNDVLIIILNNENNDSTDENECVVKSRQVALILPLTETVVIDLDL